MASTSIAFTGDRCECAGTFGPSHAHAVGVVRQLRLVLQSFSCSAVFGTYPNFPTNGAIGLLWFVATAWPVWLQESVPNLLVAPEGHVLHATQVVAFLDFTSGNVLPALAHAN
jgi:hypothetical protein